MKVALEAKDLKQMDIKYHQKDENTDGYAVAFLREKSSPVSTFHFTFSMPSYDFKEQVKALEKAADKGGFKLNIKRKSWFTLKLERFLVGALSGTEYRNRGCPACRMIDTFIAGSHSTPN